MNSIADFFNGKKTYIGSIAAGVVGLLLAFNVIDETTALALGSVIATFTGVSLRKAISKSGNGK